MTNMSWREAIQYLRDFGLDELAEFINSTKASEAKRYTHGEKVYGAREVVTNLKVILSGYLVIESGYDIGASRVERESASTQLRTFGQPRSIIGPGELVFDLETDLNSFRNQLRSFPDQDNLTAVTSGYVCSEELYLIDVPIKLAFSTVANAYRQFHLIRKFHQSRRLSELYFGAYDPPTSALQVNRIEMATKEGKKSPGGSWRDKTDQELRFKWRKEALRNWQEEVDPMLGIPMLRKWELARDASQNQKLTFQLEEILTGIERRSTREVIYTNQQAEAYSKLPIVGQYLLCQEWVRKIATEKCNLRVEGSTQGQRVDKIIDFGTGAGKSTRSLRKIFGDSPQIFGLDVSDKMIRIALEEHRTNYRAAPITEILDEAGNKTYRWPSTPASADLVVSMITLQELTEEWQMIACMKESFEALKPGGWIIHCYPHPDIRTEQFSAWSYDSLLFRINRETGTDSNGELRQCKINPDLALFIGEDPDGIVWTKDLNWNADRILEIAERVGFRSTGHEDCRVLPAIEDNAGSFAFGGRTVILDWKDERKGKALVIVWAQKPV